MRRIILLIAALVCTTQLFAQYSGRVTSTHGTVVEKVTVITIEPEVVEEEEEFFEPISYPKYDAKIGYQQEISLGWWWAESLSALRFSYVGGKRFNNYFFAGLGAGLDIGISHTYQPHVVKSKYYNIYDENGNFRYDVDVVLPMQTIAIPIYANIKGYFMRTKLAPYLSFSAGARISTGKKLVIDDYDTTSDFRRYGAVRGMFDLSVGANYRYSQDRSYTFELGYYTQNIDFFDYKYTSRNWYIHNKYWSHGFKISVGMTF